MTSNPYSNFFEPVFYRFDDGFWPKNCSNVDELEQYLVIKIRSNLLDLDRHVQRILLNIHCRRKPQLMGALQDLFIALGMMGAPIKKNMLKRSEAILSSDELAIFYQGIQERLDFRENKSSYSYLY